MIRSFLLKLPSLWAPIVFAPLALLAQVPDIPADIKAELAARQIALASQRVASIKSEVDAGIAPKLRLDAAERDLEDMKDKVIVQGAVPPPDPNESPEDAAVAAAQSRIDRQKAWTERIQGLIKAGITPAPDLIPTDAELRNRESDLTSLQARIFANAEAAELAARSSLKDESTPPDFNNGEIEHYEGLGTFDETRELKVLAKAFSAQFNRALPISADGETDVHRALGFDHRGRVDVAIYPLAPEGIWLRQYLRAHKIPYYAFTSAVRGKATAAHIHIGPGSTRLRPGTKV